MGYKLRIHIIAAVDKDMQMVKIIMCMQEQVINME